MATTDNFFKKDQYAEADINDLIANHAEESLYLEFKSRGSLDMSDSKRNEIAKDISAFANSDGGILIYGINERNHIAESLSFVNGLTYTKEWLENVIYSRISRRLPELKVIPVRFNNDFTQTIYVVKVGRSYQVPHMTSDKKFFRRLNFQAIQMEEYEIRDAYNRTNKTILSFDDLLITSDGNARQASILTEARFKISFQVKNTGAAIENQYKLEVYIPFVLFSASNPMHEYKIRTDNGIDVYSLPNTSPLFQEEKTSIGAFHLIFNRQTKRFLDEPILAKLYFSGGKIEQQFTLRDKLLVEGKPIYDVL